MYVTILISTDPSRLGETATMADVARYGENLTRLIRREFSTRANYRLVSIEGTQVESPDDTDIVDRIRAKIFLIEAGDEWVKLAFPDGQ